MRRVLSLVLVTLVVGADPVAGAGPPLAVDREPVYVRAGIAHVRVACRRISCAATLRADGPATRVRLFEGEATFEPVAVRRPRRQLVLHLREDDRTRRLRRVTRRRVDAARCGYRDRAQTLATSATARLLRVDLGGRDDYAADADVITCVGGVPRLLTVESSAEFISTELSAVVLTDRWAVVGVRTTDPKDDFGTVNLMTQSLRAPFATRSFRIAYEQATSGVTVPERLLVARDGAIAYVLDEGQGRHAVRAIDGAGPRRLDAGDGVDPASVVLTGHTVTWTRAGTPQSATVVGAARHG